MSFLSHENDENSSHEEFALHADEVHIWHASVSKVVETGMLKQLRRLLAHDERQRAERFMFKKDQDQFVVARGVLRVILSRYTGIKPKALCFEYNPFGKPELALQNGCDKISFNLSHSGKIVVYAITREREVGVDIELVRPFENADQIVERYFSDKEKAQFSSLPEDFKNEAFFTCWTRKEAFIKALGKGLSIPLDQFSISFLPGESARLVEKQAYLPQTDLWTFEDVSPAKGYVAAAAVSGENLKFRSLEWA